jgi:hypothetical protein
MKRDVVVRRGGPDTKPIVMFVVDVAGVSDDLVEAHLLGEAIKKWFDQSGGLDVPALHLALQESWRTDEWQQFRCPVWDQWAALLLVKAVLDANDDVQFVVDVGRSKTASEFVYVSFSKLGLVERTVSPRELLELVSRERLMDALVLLDPDLSVTSMMVRRGDL